MGNRVSYCEAEAAVEEVVEAPAAEEAPEEETPAEEEAKPEIKLKTAPVDYRFTSVNQARNCYTHYNEYYKCVSQKGEEDADCVYHKRFFKSICPNEWVEKWEELRSDGTWYGKY